MSKSNAVNYANFWPIRLIWAIQSGPAEMLKNPPQSKEHKVNYTNSWPIGLMANRRNGPEKIVDDDQVDLF